MAEICRKIRELTANQGLTKLDLAKKTRISYRIVLNVMKGEAVLRDQTIGRFASALGVTFEDIMRSAINSASAEVMTENDKAILREVSVGPLRNVVEEMRKAGLYVPPQTQAILIREGAGAYGIPLHSTKECDAALTVLEKEYTLSKDEIRELISKRLYEKLFKKSVPQPPGNPASKTDPGKDGGQT